MLLISLTVNGLYAQNTQQDTLKKPITDTLSADSGEESIEETIKYSAQDSVVALPQQGRAILYGKANVDYGSMNMTAEFIDIDYNKNTITAYGKKDSTGKNVGTPVFKDGEEPMEAEKIMYNLKTKRGKIFNALTKQGDLLVIGSEIKKDSTNIVYMKDMKCIPCQEADARTIFKATRAKIIPNDKIVTGPMYLEVGGVPTPLGLPFGYFPNTKKQHNGILLPTFGVSPTQGFNLRQGGFYWGINDKTDMTIRGDIYANGSWALNVTNNYRVLYKAAGYTYFGYSLFNVGDKDIPSSYSKRKAFEIKWSHNQDNRNNPSVRFSANVNYVNNQSVNRLSAINTEQFLQNNFLSNINFTKNYKLSSLSLNGTHSYNSQTGQMSITLPALTFNVNRFFPFKRENAVTQNVLDKIGISYILQANNSLTGKDSTIFKGSILDSLRYGVKQSVPISTNFNLFKYVTVTPGINLSSVSYMKSVEKNFRVDTITDTLGIKSYKGSVSTKEINKLVNGFDANFSTSFSTKVFFDYMFKKGKLSQIRHLMIPTLGYNYRPDFGTDYFGYWKAVQTSTLGQTTNYSVFERGIFGGPSYGKQNALSINLNNNFESKLRTKTDTGITYRKVVLLQNLGLGAAYNFAADSLKMSNITLSARTVVLKNININLNSSFDPYVYNKTNKADVNTFLFNTGRGPARFTNAVISVNTSLSNNMIEAAQKLRKPPSANNGAERGAENDLNPTSKQPWNLNLNYNLTLSNYDDTKIQPSHQLGITADMMPTKYWKVGVTTGYDFTQQKPSTTRISVYRDLKCWAANISWVPFGTLKSYMITLNLKSAMLSEFKIPRQRQWYDYFQ
ncbi:MAG: LPS-assembly protein LptD [Bacteroidia bacterium]|nr:LPS-assembly protein LptD [Bacteroidia bacterium]